MAFCRTGEELKEFRFGAEVVEAINNAIEKSQYEESVRKSEAQDKGLDYEPLDIPDFLDPETMVILIPLPSGKLLAGWNEQCERAKFEDLQGVNVHRFSSIGVLFAQGSCYGAITNGGAYSVNRASWAC